MVYVEGLHVRRLQIAAIGAHYVYYVLCVRACVRTCRSCNSCTHVQTGCMQAHTEVHMKINSCVQLAALCTHMCALYVYCMLCIIGAYVCTMFLQLRRSSCPGWRKRRMIALPGA